MSIAERERLAGTIRGHAPSIAEVVTRDFFQRHPDWVERYGEIGWVRGVEDASFHLDFLCGALVSGTTRSFAEYAAWASAMLGSRGIEPRFLEQNLAQIEIALGDVLSLEEHEAVVPHLRAGIAACSLPEAERARPAGSGTENVLASERAVYLQALLSGRRAAATNIALDALRQGRPVLDVYLHLFQEAQYEIGRLWASNRISVAQEHLASAVSQFVLARVYAELEPAARSLGNMIITGVEGEQHQLGANMVADVLESEGWNVQFLGTHMPHAGILDAIQEHEAEVVGISTTMLFNLSRARELAEAIHARFGPDVRIALGGAAFRSAPELWKEMGAVGYAGDLEDAVTLLC